MTRFRTMRGWVAAGAVACAVVLLWVAAAPNSGSQYLYVWAMQVRHPEARFMVGSEFNAAGLGLGKDFLAVFEVGQSGDFGKLVAMLPTGPATMAHHASYSMPPDDVLYANDWLGNRTAVFDLHDALHPRLVRQFGSLGNYGYPHSFVHLANGNTLATFQYSGGYEHAPGGLVEFDPSGQVVRASPAADAALDPHIRPYSLTVVEKLDRVVSGSADMMGSESSHVVQVWRLSDLKLIKTIVLPAIPGATAKAASNANEPRVLGDGSTVLVPTGGCGLYLMKDLAGHDPSLQPVYDMRGSQCEVPVVVGHFWVQAVQRDHRVVSLDVSDPAHPREVSRLEFPEDEHPHWIAAEPGGDRLAITGFVKLDTRVQFARIDRQSGHLTMDSQSISMTRDWPGGWKGSAMPHGVVFSNY